MASKKLQNACSIAIRDFLNYKPSESILIVSDFNKRKIGMALYEVAYSMNSDAVYLEIKPQDINGEEPNPLIANLFSEFDVVITATTKSFTHTDARRNASARGVRFATMPGITEDMLVRCLNIDIVKHEDITARVENAMQNVNYARITSKLGTDILLPITGRKIMPSLGILKTNGASGNLPSGEVYCAPLERKSNGVIVFDGSVAGIGILQEPIKVTIKDGKAVKFEGGKQAQEFEKMLTTVGEDALQIAELGIGTNYKAKITGVILEDEKVLGTVHIAFGNNKSMGGIIDVPIHIDGLIRNPSIYFDDVKVMNNGKLLV